MSEEMTMRPLFKPVLLLAALVLAGCASVPPVDTAALSAVPPQFQEADGARWTTAAGPQAEGAWWQAFGDPVLDGLVARANRANTGLQQAAARWAQARALVRGVHADRLPQLALGASAARQRGGSLSPGSAPANRFLAGADLSYEVDLSGRLARSESAAALDAGQQQALLDSTRLLVQAEVAQAYFSLRAIDVERRLVRDTVTAYDGTLRLVERRRAAGDLAELDLVRVRAEVASTRAEALALDRQRAELLHALALLLGETPSGFSLPDAEWAALPPAIPAGVPAAVLARRPDVAAAQQALLAAQARVGIAKAAWLPDVSLTASGGQASADAGDLFRWSLRSWGIGALLSLPVFDGGRRQAGVDAAGAQLDGATAAYRERVLVAVKEVEDQLSALRLLAEQAEAQSEAVGSAQRATVLSESRYRNGLVSQLELLDARRSELANRRQSLQVRAEQYQATVRLIRALGGGWEVPPAV
jgi:multidrug efflux system outer membrane protein